MVGARRGGEFRAGVFTRRWGPTKGSRCLVSVCFSRTTSYQTAARPFPAAPLAPGHHHRLPIFANRDRHTALLLAHFFLDVGPATLGAPFAILMPNPPVLRRNNNHIPRAASPRTPTCGSPAQLPIFLASAGNRKSSDSWTSSNDPREEIEAEWQSEQVLLLLRVCFSPINLTYRPVLRVFSRFTDSRRPTVSYAHSLHRSCSSFQPSR